MLPEYAEYEVSLWPTNSRSSRLRQSWERLSNPRDALTAFYQSPPMFVFDERAYAHLARCGFLHCYVLKSGDAVIGVLLGIKAGRTLKTTGVFHDPSLQRYSPGTTLWHLALTQLIGLGEFDRVDFGCGLPAYRHGSTNIIERKGRVLLFRRTWANTCVVFAYSCHASLVGFLKAALRNKRA